MAAKPLARHDRFGAIQATSAQEAYCWFSKCDAGPDALQAKKRCEFCLRASSGYNRSWLCRTTMQRLSLRSLSCWLVSGKSLHDVRPVIALQTCQVWGQDAAH